HPERRKESKAASGRRTPKHQRLCLAPSRIGVIARPTHLRPPRQAPHPDAADDTSGTTGARGRPHKRRKGRRERPPFVNRIAESLRLLRLGLFRLASLLAVAATFVLLLLLGLLLFLLAEDQVVPLGEVLGLGQADANDAHG